VKPQKQPDHTESIFVFPGALTNALSDFIDDREISGARPGTISFYRNELSIFVDWAAGTGLHDLNDITADIIRDYFVDLKSRRTRNGIYKNYTALKTWLRWSWDEYDRSGPCPINKIKVASQEAKQMPAITMDNFQKLIDTCNGRDGKRDLAILMFLFDTGIRRQELCRLTIACLRKNRTVNLEPDDTKTGEARLVFITRDTMKAILAYFAQRKEVSSVDPLFATEEEDFFTASGMRQVIRRRCSLAGLPEQGLHAFRRGFALESVRAGADIISVSRQLGHSRIETTKRYLPQSEDDIKSVHDRTSPINRLAKRKKN
jgi:integrase/recombinase XerD